MEKSKKGKIRNTIKWTSQCNQNDQIIARNNLQKREYIDTWKKIPNNYKISEDSQITKSEYINILTLSLLRPLYIGHIDVKNKFKRRYLKIFDFTNVKDTDKKSKRTELRGKVCGSFLSIQILLNIKKYLEEEVNKLKLSNFTIPVNVKFKKENVCIIIEFLLRILHKYNEKIWIINTSFDSGF